MRVMQQSWLVWLGSVLLAACGSGSVEQETDVHATCTVPDTAIIEYHPNNGSLVVLEKEDQVVRYRELGGA